MKNVNGVGINSMIDLRNKYVADYELLSKISAEYVTFAISKELKANTSAYHVRNLLLIGIETKISEMGAAINKLSKDLKDLLV